MWTLTTACGTDGDGLVSQTGNDDDGGVIGAMRRTPPVVGKAGAPGVDVQEMPPGADAQVPVPVPDVIPPAPDVTEPPVCVHQVEACDGKDNDCDGVIDNNCVPDPGRYKWGLIGPPGWGLSKDYCEQQGQVLVQINSAAELDAVARICTPVFEPSVQNYGPCAWWIGLHSPNRDGKWVWTNGRAPIFTAWASGKPNNATGNEWCVQMFVSIKDGVRIVEWNDLDCGQRASLVCEVGP